MDLLFVGSSGAEWDKLFDEKRRQEMAGLLSFTRSLLSNLCWFTLQDITEAQEVKAALQCIGSAVQFIVDGWFGFVVGNKAADVPTEVLSGLVKFGEFNELKPFVNRKESLGNKDVVAAFTRLQSFMRGVIQPRAVAVLDAQSCVPMEKLKDHWRGATTALRVVERSLVEGDSTTNADLEKSLKDAAEIDAQVDLDAFTSAVSSRLQSQRGQVLHRVISATNVVGTTWTGLLKKDLTPDAETIVNDLSKLQHEGSSLQAWVDGNKASFDDIKTGWFADGAECERTLTLLNDLVRHGNDIVAKFLAQLTIFVSGQLPSRSMLEDPLLLTDPVRQKVFIDILNNSQGGTLVAKLSKWNSVLRDAKAKGLNITQPADLLHVRQHGKRCCGAHSVLSALSNPDVPKKSEELEAYIVTLEAKLRKKGIGSTQGMVALPQRFSKALSEIKAASREAATKVPAEVKLL